jgi:hypothetical protein
MLNGFRAVWATLSTRDRLSWKTVNVGAQELAPREEHRFEHGFGEPNVLLILRAVNQGEEFVASSWVVKLSMIKQQSKE